VKDYTWYSCVRTPFGFHSPCVRRYHTFTLADSPSGLLCILIAACRKPPTLAFVLARDETGWSGVTARPDRALLYPLDNVMFLGDLASGTHNPAHPILGLQDNGTRWIVACKGYRVRRSDFDTLFEGMSV
jgi:hypothetical protein